MGYMTNTISIKAYWPWFAFAGVGGIGNGGLVLTATEVSAKLKELWPDAETIPGYAAAAAIFVLLVAVLALLARTAIFVEILQSGAFGSVLYAWYSFYPAMGRFEGGLAMFWVLIVLVVIGYGVSQRDFAVAVFTAGSRTDKFAYSLVLTGTAVLFLVPPFQLSLAG